ncbi:hypothetical protein GO986_08665 [Deinococcus sp. HMF7620]|uniref:Uncharacterized protein n=1 Tax=Deinococcus arboris TaxID=2682977 RepID=A0A7C9HRA0_9DEIO|nr:hypothetical protein [Deinococcus arboris]MVN86834.1 hypothetical protein [Deinococcus arboris]
MPRRLSKRQQDREFKQALAQTDDPILRRLIRARYQQQRRGYVRIRPGTAFYLYDLGLLSVTTSSGTPQHNTDHPPVIRRPRLARRGAA